MRAFSILLAAATTLLGARCQINDGVTAPASIEDPGVALERPQQLAQVTVGCGASVVADLKLGNDLFCTGDALVVDADGVIIDLNGHTLTGPGSGIGITVRGRQNVTIRGGTIRSFTTGIFVANSSGVLVRGNKFTQNREGVFQNGSSDNVVMENEAWQNQLRGTMLRPTLSGTVSTRNLVKENALRENPSGILLFGQPGNTFSENRVSPGWTGNDFVENRLLQNTCGMQGTTAGNTFSENRLIGNDLDFC